MKTIQMLSYNGTNKNVREIVENTTHLFTKKVLIEKIIKQFKDEIKRLESEYEIKILSKVEIEVKPQGSIIRFIFQFDQNTNGFYFSSENITIIDDISFKEVVFTESRTNMKFVISNLKLHPVELFIELSKTF